MVQEDAFMSFLKHFFPHPSSKIENERVPMDDVAALFKP